MSETDDQEEARTELVGGVIQREYWGWDDHACITYCRGPMAKHRGQRCPSCWGRVVVRDIEGTDVEPQPGRFAYQLGSFMAGWAATWRDCTVGMVRKPPAVGVICKGDAFV